MSDAPAASGDDEPDGAGAGRRPDDRLVGKVMLIVGVVSMIVGAAGAVVGSMLISSLRSSVDDSLQLTSDTLDTAGDSITLSASIVETLRLSIDSVSDALGAVQTSIDESATTLGNVGEFLSGPLVDTLESVSEVFPTLQATASAMDDALGLLSRVPFGPDYQPAVPFGDTISGLADAIAPLPRQLQLLDADFVGLQASADEVSARLDAVIVDVDALIVRLDGIDEILDRYAETAVRAKMLAVDSRDELDRNAALGIMLAMLIGVLVVAGQIVPLWLGRRLATGAISWPLGREPVVDDPDPPS